MREGEFRYVFGEMNDIDHYPYTITKNERYLESLSL